MKSWSKFSAAQWSGFTSDDWYGFLGMALPINPLWIVSATFYSRPVVAGEVVQQVADPVFPAGAITGVVVCR